LPCQEGDGAAGVQGEVSFVRGHIGAAGDDVVAGDDGEPIARDEAAAVEALVGGVQPGLAGDVGVLVFMRQPRQ